jgi:hypothetical protein
MNFVFGVKTLDDFERPDLTAARGRMKEIALDPQDSHAV